MNFVIILKCSRHFIDCRTEK